MIKIVLISLICAIIIIYLKAINSDLVPLVLVASGIILLSASFDYIISSFAFVNEIVNASGIDKEFILIIFKIIGIAYLIEFTAETIKDLGVNSLADKLIFIGKIVIFFVSLPILYSVFNLLLGLVNSL